MVNADKALGELFNKLVEVMAKQLDAKDEVGNSAVPAATLKEVREFLKQNGIESRPEAHGGALQRLAEKVPFKLAE